MWRFLDATRELALGWFDVHAHLTDRRLAAQEEAVLARARDAGVTTILSNGLNPSDNQAVAALANRSGGLVRPCFGLRESRAAGATATHAPFKCSSVTQA